MLCLLVLCSCVQLLSASVKAIGDERATYPARIAALNVWRLPLTPLTERTLALLTRAGLLEALRKVLAAAGLSAVDPGSLAPALLLLACFCPCSSLPSR